MHLFIPSFFFVFHLCIISQLCSLKVCLVACWSITLRSGTRITLCRTGSKVVQKNIPVSPRWYRVTWLLYIFLVCIVWWWVKCMTSIFVGVLLTTVVRRLACKYLNVLNSRTMLTCLIGRRFGLDKCLPRSHGDGEICPLFITLNTFPNRDLRHTTSTMLICRSVFLSSFSLVILSPHVLLGRTVS